MFRSLQSLRILGLAALWLVPAGSAATVPEAATAGGRAAEIAAAPTPRLLDEVGLTPQALAELLGVRQLVYVHPLHRVRTVVGGEVQEFDARFVSSVAVMDAPPEAVRKTMLDVGSYVEFMPFTEKSELVSRGEGEARVDIGIRMELPVRDARVNPKLRYAWDPTDPTGDLVWGQIPEERAGQQGRSSFHALPDGRTLFVYTAWTDWDQLGFLIRQIMNAQPDLKLALPVSQAALIAGALAKRFAPEAVKPRPRRGPPEIPLLTKTFGDESAAVRALDALTREGMPLLLHPPQLLVTPDGQPIEMTFITAAAPMQIPVAEAKRWGTRFDLYPEFMEQVRRAEMERTPRGFEVHWRLGLGFGIFAVPLSYKLEYIWAAENAMPFRRIAGDISMVYGAWEWIPVGEDRTLLAYTNASHIDDDSSFVARMSSLLPNRELVISLSTAALLFENQVPWMEQQVAKGRSPD